MEHNSNNGNHKMAFSTADENRGPPTDERKTTMDGWERSKYTHKNGAD